MIPTEDPSTWIIEKDSNRTVYENTDGKRWEISGNCNQCGLCETYNNEPLNTEVVQKNYRMVNGNVEEYDRILIWRNYPGTPGAVEEVGHESRKDLPITPELAETPGCSFNGRWL